MRILKIKILFVFIFVLFFYPLIVQAMPLGTIFYKTSENGKMYGYNNFDFSLITGKFYPGGAAIYIGRDRLKNYEPTILEVDYNGVRKIPAKYFVDLDKGEEFIGAKIPNGFKGITNQTLRNALNQEGEGFDFTYHKQKGPQSGDWTPVGFVEKVYESAESVQLTYHPEPIWNYSYYSAFNITPDGYDNESEINDNHDCFSESMEFSKIHRLGQGGFFERFFTKEVKSLVQAIQSSLSEAADEIISLNVFGKKYNTDRYFFFPYTQFKQLTLQEIKVDIPVASHGKAQAVGELSSATILRFKTVAFSERVLRELTIERVKKLAQDFVGLGKIISVFRSAKETVGMVEEGIQLMSGDTVNINTEKFVEETVSKNKHISAALSWMEETEEFIQAGINESLEFFDLVNKGHLTGPEYERRMNLELARIDQLEEQVFGDIESEPEHFEATKETIPKTELSDLVELLEKEEIGLGEVGKENLFSPEEIVEVDPLQIEVPEESEEVEEPAEPEELLLSQYSPGDIVINEFVADPAQGESEWIELYNNTNQTIDLSNWTIEDNIAKPKSLKNLTINPKSWLVLNNGQHFSFNLNNSGDIIKLKYQDVLIDQVCYGDFDDGNISDNAPTAAKEQSLARKNNQDTDQDKNDWAVTSLPTPGLMNKIIVPVSEPIIQPQNSSGGGGGGSSSPNYQSYQMGDVVINEIMYNPSSSDTGHEWIEIYNASVSEIDLNGWKFYTTETNHTLIFKKGNWILPVGGYAIIADDADQFVLDYPNFIGTVFDSSFSLKNTSETIALKDGQGNTINEITYSSEWGGDDNNKTIEKKSDGNWRESSEEKGTPGEQNRSSVNNPEDESLMDTILPSAQASPDQTAEINQSINLDGSDSTDNIRIVSYQWDVNESDGLDWANPDLTGPTPTFESGYSAAGTYVVTLRVADEAGNVASDTLTITISNSSQYQISYSLGDIVVNEFVPRPAEGEGEWIELYNTTDKQINLNGWSIEDNTGNKKSLNDLMINAKSWAVFKQVEDFNFYLNNSGDIIKLKYKEAIINQVGYGNFDDGNINDNAPVAGEGISIARKIDGQNTNQDNNDFSLTITPTLGQSNVITEPELEPESEPESDTTPPTIASHDDVTVEAAVSASGAVVTYIAPDATDTVDGNFSAICSPVSGSTFALGTTSVTCNASDVAGNAATPTIFNVIVEDKISPVISNVFAANITYNSATITWETDESSDSQIEYGLTTSYGNFSAVNPISTKIHSIALSNLGASKTYHFRVLSEDTSNNQASLSDFTFTTSSALDTTPPNIQITSSITKPITGEIFNASTWQEEQEEITGTASSLNNDLDRVEIQVQKGLETQYLDNSNATSTLTWIDSDFPPWLEAILDSNTTSSTATWHFNLTVDLLTEDNYYFIRSQAFDSLDNAQNATSTVDFIFDATPPEKVTGLKIEEEYDSLDFTLFWDVANDNLSGIDYYQVWDENNNWNSGNTTSTADVTFNLTGENGTDYSFEVRACDKAGNCGEFSDQIEYKIDIQLLVIFEDNFDDGDADGWTEMGPENCLIGTCPAHAWQVDSDRYMVELKDSTTDYTQTLAGDTAWQDYQFDVDLTFYNGVDRYIIFRYQDSEHYYLINFRGYWEYMKPNTPAVYLYKMVPGMEIKEGNYLAISRFPGKIYFNENQKYHLTVVAQGDQFQIYLDGEKLIDYIDDDNPIIFGKIGFAVWTGHDRTGKMSIDNVVLRPVVEPLNLPLISIPQLSDDFNDGQADGWKETGPDNAWSMEDGQYVLEMHSQSLKAESAIGDYNWQDYQIDLDVTLIDGVDRYILFRRTDDENYYCIDLMGKWTWSPKLSLSRTSTQSGNDGSLGEINVWPEYNFNNETHHVKIIVQGERIKVYLNDETMPRIDYEDKETRLTRGNIALGGWTGHDGDIIVYWDNIQINPL